MKSFYVVYLTTDKDVIFSQPYSSFTVAKENIETFLNSTLNTKKVTIVSKDDLEKIKANKLPEDLFYVRKKISQATVYFRNTLTGRIYNSYSIEKYAKLNIQEFNVAETPVEPIYERKKETIEKMSHGGHVAFISELKDKVNKFQQRSVPSIDNLGSNNCVKQLSVSKANLFVESLIQRKQTLKNITPPPPRKLIL